MKTKLQCILIGYPGEQSAQQHLNQLIKMEYKIDISFTSTFYARNLMEVGIASTYLDHYDISYDYVLQYRYEKERFMDILSKQPDYAAIFTRYFTNIHQIIEVIRIIKKHSPDTKVIFGGAFLVNVIENLNKRESEKIFELIDADYYINKIECYQQICDVILASSSNELNNISGLTYKLSESHRYTNVMKQHQMNVLPVDWTRFSDSMGTVSALRTKISCPFSCSFCSVKNKELPFNSIDLKTVQSELEKIAIIQRTKLINFTDETINLPKNKFKIFLRMLCEMRLGIKWYAFLRCEYVDYELVSLMKESGCIAVLLGLESGNQDILDRMNKQTIPSRNIEGIQLLKQFDIKLVTFFIVGFPTETRETLEDTVRFIKKIQPDFYKLNVWECDYNTKIWSERDKYQLKYNKYTWKHSTMTEAEAKENIKQMHQKISCSIDISNFDYSFALQMLVNGLSKNEIIHCLVNQKIRGEIYE